MIPFLYFFLLLRFDSVSIILVIQNTKLQVMTWRYLILDQYSVNESYEMVLFNAVKEVKTQTQTTCHRSCSLCQSDEEAEFLWLTYLESARDAASSLNERGISSPLVFAYFFSLFDICILESLKPAGCGTSFC